MVTYAESLRHGLTALGLVFIAAASARGGTFNDVQIAGLWSNPVLAGPLYTVDPQTYAITSQLIDNTLTAVYSTTGGTLQWGSSPQASTVTFVGNSYQTLPLNQQTALGTFTYFNGTSSTETLIFGAALTLSVPNTSITALAAPLDINTTSNSGLCDSCDADYISFDPLGPVRLDQTLNVLEGQTAMFTLYGSFIGDPTIQLTDLVLVPGQTGGFVGTGPATPEPGTLGLFSVALAVIVILNCLRLLSHRDT